MACRQSSESEETEAEKGKETGREGDKKGTGRRKQIDRGRIIGGSREGGIKEEQETEA